MQGSALNPPCAAPNVSFYSTSRKRSIFTNARVAALLSKSYSSQGRVAMMNLFRLLGKFELAFDSLRMLTMAV